MVARRSFQKWIWIGLAGLGLVVTGVLVRFFVLPDLGGRNADSAATPAPSAPKASPSVETEPPEAEDEAGLSYEEIQAKQEAARQRMLERRGAAQRELQERREAKQAERRKRKEERQAKRAEWREKREAFMAEHPDPNRPTGPPFEEAPRGPAIYYEEGEAPPEGIPPAPYEERRESESGVSSPPKESE